MYIYIEREREREQERERQRERRLSLCECVHTCQNALFSANNTGFCVQHALILVQSTVHCRAMMLAAALRFHPCMLWRSQPVGSTPETPSAARSTFLRSKNGVAAVKASLTWILAGSSSGARRSSKSSSFPQHVRIRSFNSTLTALWARPRRSRAFTTSGGGGTGCVCGSAGGICS